MDLLDELYDRMEEDLDGLARVPEGLSAVVDARFGEVTVRIDHDPVAEMIRVSVAVPPPAGAGRSFLVWSLSTNAMYWDVKLGLDARGRVLVHADLDATEGSNLDDLSAALVERAEAVVDLLDDDFVGWLHSHGLGTPAQRERWEAYALDDVDEL